MRSTIQHEAVFQRIVYSQCWEDPEIAAEALAMDGTDDLLCLTSAGDNVLALALSGPRSITAIDFSASQNALLELKIAALRSLSWGEYAGFLGARPSRDRVATYRTRLRGELRDPVRDLFDGNEAVLARGVIHGGRFQRYLRIFQRGILPMVTSRRTLETLMSIEDRDERAAFYDEQFDNRRWRALFTMFFGRAVMARLGRDPAFFQFVERDDIGREFLRRTRDAIVESSPIRNHFLQYALLGRYPNLEYGPVYLREASFEALRAATDRIQIVRGDLESHLGTLADGSLSALYLSDLFEWVSPAHHEAMLRAIARATRSGGRLVYWNLLVPRSRPESLADLVAVHPERSAELHARDLAFVYGSFHLETIR
jgi:S-adenosylmethionine-diacylglycerol 3-amino-3-carboxypropyl transferase